MKNELKDHIDDPIKKTVVGLSLLGFKTHMSCCGFNYKGSQVKKSHMTGKAYVYLDTKQIFESPDLKEKLCDLSMRSAWKVDVLGNEYVDFYGPEWPKGEPWGAKDTVHFYEKPLLNISALNKAIKIWEPSFQDYAYIRDGNHKYKELTTYWQYEPAERWFVTPKTWAELPY